MNIEVLKNEQVEFLVEELSMKNLLQILLPKVLPVGYRLNANCFIRVHEGKQDLQKQLPAKVKAYLHQNRPFKVIIIQDQDSEDCMNLKDKLKNLVSETGNIPHLIRIACMELEAWYFGDLAAVESAYPSFKAKKYRNKALYRTPDTIVNPSGEMKKLISSFQKGKASREIPPYMSLDANTSVSFNQLVTGIFNFLNQDKE